MRGNQCVTARDQASSRRSTPGSKSGRSSASKPGPKSLAAAPCSQTPAAAAAERFHALREQSENHPAEHIAGTRGRERRRRIRIDHRPAVGRGDDRIRALEHDHRTARACRRARASELVSGHVEQAREFTVVRREHARAGDGGEQSFCGPARTR